MSGRWSVVGCRAWSSRTCSRGWQSQRGICSCYAPEMLLESRLNPLCWTSWLAGNWSGSLQSVANRRLPSMVSQVKHRGMQKHPLTRARRPYGTGQVSFCDVSPPAYSLHHMRAGRTSTTPATSPAMSGLRRWSSYLYMHISGLFLFSVFLSV